MPKPKVFVNKIKILKTIKIVIILQEEKFQITLK